MSLMQNRRRFLSGLSWAAAGLAGLRFPALAAEPPPETTTIRILAYPAACNAPMYIAEELLREEGFAEVRYVPPAGMPTKMLADGGVDLSMESGFDFLPLMDDGRPLTVLAGIHTGCFELRANDSIRTIADLRGKRVGVTAPLGGSADYLLVSAMAAYVGLDPAKDIAWVANPDVNQVDLFKAGEVEAFVGFPPDPKQPCARDVGHVVVNTATDPPWSDYFCCMATANGDFVRNNPVATKRALRAILRATDICHKEPERAAQRMVVVGFSAECARMILNDARYGLWRDYDPEDTVRYMALRLHEAGLIKKTPNEVIGGFTDWRFLNEIKRELT
jgi:NitT/TauT family transport system substrate-binding protein